MHITDTTKTQSQLSMIRVRMPVGCVVKHKDLCFVSVHVHASVLSYMHEHICSSVAAMDVPTCRRPSWSSSRK